MGMKFQLVADSHMQLQVTMRITSAISLTFPFLVRFEHSSHMTD